MTSPLPTNWPPALWAIARRAFAARAGVVAVDFRLCPPQSGEGEGRVHAARVARGVEVGRHALADAPGRARQMEYLAPLSGRFGQAFRYHLLYDPDQQNETGRFLAGLKSVEQLRQEANLAGILHNLAGEKTNLAPQKGNLAPTSQVPIREVLSEAKPHEHRAKPLSTPNFAPFSGEHISGKTPETARAP